MPRLDAGIEFTVWLVACEAVVNAQKHARATRIEVDVTIEDRMLRLRVRDDGIGGANPEGPGLRGLRDRTRNRAWQPHALLASRGVAPGST